MHRTSPRMSFSRRIGEIQPEQQHRQGREFQSQMNRRQPHRTQRRDRPKSQAGPLNPIEEIQPGEERSEEFHPGLGVLECRRVAGHIRQKSEAALMTVMKVKMIPGLGFKGTHDIRLDSPLQQRAQRRIRSPHREPASV